MPVLDVHASPCQLVCGWFSFRVHALTPNCTVLQEYLGGLGYIKTTTVKQTVISMREYPNLSGSANLLGILGELGVVRPLGDFALICSHFQLEPGLPVNAF